MRIGNDRALQSAALSGFIAMVAYFLDRGADFNVGNGAPLLSATSNGDMPMILFLE